MLTFLLGYLSLPDLAMFTADRELELTLSVPESSRVVHLDLEAETRTTRAQAAHLLPAPGHTGLRHKNPLYS
ncbi:hypothetical protein AMTR_s00025p00242630 [Amborella trichopoda]|uniref:Uncharacterized protein n=1 Tax=Amborella trichopoda TaxID=13333 RepID=W1PYS8_AMBTC|nr:hypothetical protein AMTR_s00025p00242630 [Amborella trichopoda]